MMRDVGYKILETLGYKSNCIIQFVGLPSLYIRMDATKHHCTISPIVINAASATPTWRPKSQ